MHKTSGTYLAISILSLILNFSNISTLRSQNTVKDLTGEYSLTGIPEMASGFKFNNDNTFQFFYIYGASDRQAHGTYSTEGSRIVLKGSKSAGNDFSLIQKLNNKSGNNISVKITDKNVLLLKNVVCYFMNAKDTVFAETNSEGIAVAEMPDCNQIQLIHSFFPDMPSILEVDINEYNYFEFSLNPSLAEVVFDNYIIEHDETDTNVLYCSNKYLFPGEKVIFVKHK